MVPIGSRRTNRPSPVAIGADNPGQAPRRCGRVERGSGHAVTSRTQQRQTGVDVVAARMPEAAPPRRIEPLGDRGGGLRILAQQKFAHVGVGDIGVVQEIEQFAGHRVGGFGESDQAIDGFGKLGGAARAVAHLAGDEARIDRACAHDPRQRRRQRPRPRPLRIGDVEHDEIGRAAEHLCRRGEAADEGRVLAAFEQIAAGIVARMHKRVGVGDALRKCAGRCVTFAVGAAIGVRRSGEISRSDRVGSASAAEQILDA